MRGAGAAPVATGVVPNEAVPVADVEETGVVLVVVLVVDVVVVSDRGRDDGLPAGRRDKEEEEGIMSVVQFVDE